VKIYRFNPDTGIYLGEDFADEAPMKRGAFMLPPDATTIAPPEVKRGQLLAFNCDEKSWEVKEGTRIHRPIATTARNDDAVSLSCPSLQRYENYVLLMR
jgi:hypothetical protein